MDEAAFGGPTHNTASLMQHFWDIPSWPLALKIPVLVTVLLITAGAATSQVMLSQFSTEQENNVGLLARTYLDGLSAAILPALVRRDSRELFDALDRAKTSHHSGVEPLFSILELPNGAILASSDPRRFPVQGVIPAEIRHRFATSDGVDVEARAGRAFAARTLRVNGFPAGRLFAELDITDSLRVRHDMLLSLALVNGCLTVAFALVGYFALKRTLRPLGILARHVEQIRDGRVELVPVRYRSKIADEFKHLFERFNAMARAVAERQDLAARLAEQEKCAMLGRLASGMAHEVNNPLGGMLNAIDTIETHGHDPAVRQQSLNFLKRGLAGIRNVVQATLTSYKEHSETRLLTRADIDDLRVLVQHEIHGRRLRLHWENLIPGQLAVDGPAVRQIILNLLINACAVSTDGAYLAMSVARAGQDLEIIVADQGPGLPPEMRQLLNQAAHGRALSPEGKGLGLWMTGRLVHRLHGRVHVQYPDVGTRVIITLPIEAEAFHVAA